MKLTKAEVQTHMTRMKELMEKAQDLRRGQAHFITLSEHHPEMAEEVRKNKEVDPFSNDGNIAAFLKFITL